MEVTPAREYSVKGDSCGGCRAHGEWVSLCPPSESLMLAPACLGWLAVPGPGASKTENQLILQFWNYFLL